MTLFCQTQRKICWRKFVTRLFWGTIDFHSRKKNTMEVNCVQELLCFSHSSEYLPLCSADQRHSYSLGTTWGWVNDDIIFIIWWITPLTMFNNSNILYALFQNNASSLVIVTLVHTLQNLNVIGWALAYVFAYSRHTFNVCISFSFTDYFSKFHCSTNRWQHLTSVFMS